MGFYGNITNTTKTQFTFDRIYPCMKVMMDNATTDQVYIGRYVLVDYDEQPSQETYIKNLYLDSFNVPGIGKPEKVDLIYLHATSITNISVEPGALAKEIEIVEDNTSTSRPLQAQPGHMVKYENKFYIWTGYKWSYAKAFDALYFTGIATNEGTTIDTIDLAQNPKTPIVYLKNGTGDPIKYEAVVGHRVTCGKDGLEYIYVADRWIEYNCYLMQPTNMVVSITEGEAASTKMLIDTLICCPSSAKDNNRYNYSWEYNDYSQSYYFTLTNNMVIQISSTQTIVYAQLINVPVEAGADTYLKNYNFDKQYQATKGFSIGRGFDSTVWQKVYRNNIETYVMIAELNSVVPTFDIGADAPTMSPIVPHFDANSTNVYYKLHWQPQWGLRLKSANIENGFRWDKDGNESSISIGNQSKNNNVYPSDEKTVWSRYEYDSKTDTLKPFYYNKNVEAGDNGWQYNPDDTGTDASQHPYDLSAAVFYNKEGFNSKESFLSSDKSIKREESGETIELPIVDEIKLAPTGKSGHVYQSHAAGEDAIVKEDIQELSIMLPSIGDSISQVWDIVYGDRGQNGYELDPITGKYIKPEEGEFERHQNIDWIDGSKIDEDADLTLKDKDYRLKLIDLLADGSGYEFDKLSKADTVAGAINTLHDLMGMIIVDDTSTEEGYVHITPSEASDDRIYYREVETSGQKGFFIKGKDYNYEPALNNDGSLKPAGKANVLELANTNTNKYFYKEGINYLMAENNGSPDFFSRRLYKNGKWKKVELAGDYDPTKSYYYTRSGSQAVDDNHHYEYFIRATEKTIQEGQDYFLVGDEGIKGITAQWVYFYQKTGTDIFHAYWYADRKKVVVNEDGIIQIEASYQNDAFYPICEADPPAISYGEVTWDKQKQEHGEVVQYEVSENVYEDAYYIDDIGQKKSIFNLWSIRVDDDGNLKFTPFLNDGNFRIVDFQYPAKGVESNNIFYSQDTTNENIFRLININPGYNPKAQYVFTFENIVPLDSFYQRGKYYYAKYKDPAHKNLGASYYKDFSAVATEDRDYYKLEAAPEACELLFKPGYYYKTINCAEIANSYSDLPETSGDYRIGYTKRDAYVGTTEFYKEIDDAMYGLPIGTKWNDSLTNEQRLAIYEQASAIISDEDELKKVFSYNNQIDAFIELKEFSKKLNTANGLIVRINQMLQDGDLTTRDLDTVQGCINQVKDIIAKFGNLDPNDIVIVDSFGRVHGAKHTTKQEYIYTNTGKNTTSTGVTAEDQFIKLHVNDNALAPIITIEHKNHSVTSTTTTADKNTQPESGPGDGINAGAGDTLKLYQPIIDNMGHIVGQNTETVKLPFGYKHVSGDTGSITADNTQDEFSVITGDSWLTTEAKNQSIIITHDVPNGTMTTVKPDSTKTLSNYGSNFKVPTFKYDARGHVSENGSYTITLPGLNTEAVTNAAPLGTIVTSITDPDDATVIKYNLQNFATVLLTGYNKSDASGTLNSNDNVNAAFSKVENHLSTLDTNLANEIARAKQAEADEKTARENADNAEATARQNKDTELATAIATEATNRANAISSEASTRLNADNALDVRVTALETNIPTTYETKANVTALSNTVQTLQQTIISQATTIATLQGTIETLQSALTALELRVKALEDKE